MSVYRLPQFDINSVSYGRCLICTMTSENVFAMSLKLERVYVFTCKHCTCVPHANKCHFPFQLRYRADLMWMKGAGCITEGSLNIQQAKKAGDLVSEVS